MSANWYTFQCRCDDETRADEHSQALLPLQEEDHQQAVRNLNQLGKSNLKTQLIEDWYLENLQLMGNKVVLEMQGAASGDLPEQFPIALSNAGAELLHVNIFYDQVGEEVEYLYRHGAQIDLDDNEEALDELGFNEGDIERLVDQIKKKQLSPNYLIDGRPVLLQIFDECMDNETEAVIAVLDAGAKLPEDEDQRDELIEHSIHSSDEKLIKRLIESGLDYCAYAREGSSPLLSLETNSKQAASILRLLIEAGIDTQFSHNTILLYDNRHTV